MKDQRKILFCYWILLLSYIFTEKNKILCYGPYGPLNKGSVMPQSNERVEILPGWGVIFWSKPANTLEAHIPLLKGKVQKEQWGNKPGPCSTVLVPPPTAGCLSSLCVSGPWLVGQMLLFHPRRRASAQLFHINQCVVHSCRSHLCWVPFWQLSWCF